MLLPVSYRRGQRKPYGSIPRINRAHPRSRGLVFYAYDAGGYLVDLVSGSRAAIFNSPNPPVTNSPFGSGLNYASGAGNVIFPILPAVNSILASKLYSAACAWNLTALPSILNTNPFGLCDLGNIQPIAFLFDASVNTDIQVIWSNQNTTPITGNSINKFHSILCTNTSATAQNTYLDGVFIQSEAFTATFTTTTARVLFNAADLSTPTTDNGIAGWIHYGAIWDRTVPAWESMSIHNEPWDHLIYPEDEMFAEWVGAAAVAAVKQNQTSILQAVKRASYW